jgi:hypothetical protein
MCAPATYAAITARFVGGADIAGKAMLLELIFENAGPGIVRVNNWWLEVRAMNEPIKCRLADNGDWIYLTAAGWQPTPWRNGCAWEYVWRWFLSQGIKAERVKEPEKLEVLQ